MDGLAIQPRRCAARGLREPRPPPAGGTRRRRDRAFRRRQSLRIVDEALAATAWLSGADFGIGDIPVGVYAHTFLALDIPRPPLPRLEARYARLRARPAYAETVMIPLT